MTGLPAVRACVYSGSMFTNGKSIQCRNLITNAHKHGNAIQIMNVSEQKNSDKNYLDVNL